MDAPGTTYLLGDYLLAPDKRLLSRAGQPVSITSKPFHVLVYLVEHRDRVVSRAELLDRFWDGKDVYDDVLRKTVASIRKALGDNGEHPRFIETHYGEGYRYIGPLEPAQPVETMRAVRIVIEEELQDGGAELDASGAGVPVPGGARPR